jgi:dUTP pyrophosphatase
MKESNYSPRYKKIKINKLTHAVSLPSFGTEFSSGLDLYAANSSCLILNSFERTVIPTGIQIELPLDSFSSEDPSFLKRYEAQVRSRSGLALKHGIITLNSPGTIDSDYRGEIMVILMNLSKEAFVIERGMRIAQLVIAQCIPVVFEEEAMNITLRGASGFGSTGLKSV